MMNQLAPTVHRNIHYIPAQVSFVDALADGLLSMAGDDLTTLAGMRVLLPNRRACRALQDAFLERSATKVGGAGAILLPNLQPIGDLDEEDLQVLGPGILGEAIDIKPAIGPLRRRMMLSRMILARGAIGGETPRLDQAIQLADALGRLLDEVETEGLSLDALDDLVAGELAQHWQVTLEFFDLLRRQWPLVLKQEGAIDPAERRNRILELQGHLWRLSPPAGPVIAAGSTGSIPATARLLETIATLPLGAIVLPGLDMALDEEDWAAIEQDPSHPQFGLSQLLRRLGVSRDDVSLWPGVAPHFRPSGRAWLVSMAMLPAERTGRWRQLTELASAESASFHGLQRLDCRNEQDEALVVALALRRFVEQNATGKAALVTPDRGLAVRVAGELGRWEIEIDDSAGRPLARSPCGVFLLALARAASQQWAPVPLLSLLKHSLCASGRREGEIGRWAGRLEVALLRGPRPAPGWRGLRAVLDRRKSEISTESAAGLGSFLNDMETRTEAMLDWRADQSPQARLRVLIRTAEALAEGPGVAGPERLYRGEDGEALALFLGEALTAFSGLPACDAETFTAMLQELLAGIDVRPRFGRHPRLFIWGPLEARLQQADLVILGGLNEGTWPAEGGDDPWMSRPMRAQFGLAPLERRVGLAAHDFQQALGAGQVLMTRALRANGAPSVPSRWLLRLEAIGATLKMPKISAAGDLQLLAGLLDESPRPEPCARPAPAPGASARPRSLSVTRIEAWRRDPYAIYAAKILRLEKLDPLDQDPDVADLGTIIHRALDRHVAGLAKGAGQDELAALLQAGREAFGEFIDRPNVWAFWWPRFERIAAWFIDIERDRRPSIARSLTEASAKSRILDGPVPFELTAKADRLDLKRDQGLVVIDYKTGGLPSDGDIRLGYAPQLALEAMLARQGAFAGMPAISSVAEIAYWQLKGDRTGGAIHNPSLNKSPLDPNQLAVEAEAGLRRLLEHFGREGAAYPALPDLRYAPRYNDYDHLERVLEWSGGSGES